MGTEIHAYLEQSIVPRAGAHSIIETVATFHLHRDYRMFGLLAGVRGELEAVIPPRGLPYDLGRATEDAIALTVDDEQALLDLGRFCSRAQADAWVASGRSRYLGDKQFRVVDPEVFGGSWLTTEELALVVARYREWLNGAPRELEAILAAMRALDSSGPIARLVLWFTH